MSKKLVDFDSREIESGLKNAKLLTGGLSDDEITIISEIVEVEEFEKGEHLVKEDEDSRDIMVVYSGVASVGLKLNPSDDSAKQIQRLREGSVMGEFSFIDGSKRSANVRVIKNVVIFRLVYEKLSGVCESNHRIGYVIMKNLANIMSQRLRNTNFELRSHLYI